MSSAVVVTVARIVASMDARYPPAWADDWDRVGLVVGDPAMPVRRVLFVVDCVPETVDEAMAVHADMIVAHHPLLLRGVSSVAATSYKGRIVHQLIKNDIALHVAHTNADHANPGVSDALAARLGLIETRPLRPLPLALPDEAAGEAPARGVGRVGRLREPMPLDAFAERVAVRLPATTAGVRAAGDPKHPVDTVAVCGGAGDSFLADAVAAGVDAYVTGDLRHHPASEHIASGGPALIDVAHWASERPWLDDAAAALEAHTGVATAVCDVDTDPWTIFYVNKEPEA
jgi:dinuclear metal center YbgI/SA1388 family protein